MDTFIVVALYTIMAMAHAVILGALILKVYHQTDLESEDNAFIIFTSLFWPVSLPVVILPMVLDGVSSPINLLSKKLLNLFNKGK